MYSVGLVPLWQSQTAYIPLSSVGGQPEYNTEGGLYFTVCSLEPQIQEAFLHTSNPRQKSILRKTFHTCFACENCFGENWESTYIMLHICK